MGVEVSREGTIERVGKILLFRYQRQLPHPIEHVWSAITEPAEIERWTGRRPEIDLRPGGEYVTGHCDDGVPVVDRVLRVEAPTLFEHTFWAKVNPDARVTWELSSTTTGCLLQLTHRMSDADIERGAATVASGDHPAVIIARNGAGWHRLLDKIQQLLDGSDGDCSPQDQQVLQKRYAALIPES